VASLDRPPLVLLDWACWEDSWLCQPSSVSSDVPNVDPESSLAAETESASSRRVSSRTACFTGSRRSSVAANRAPFRIIADDLGWEDISPVV